MSVLHCQAAVVSFGLFFLPWFLVSLGRFGRVVVCLYVQMKLIYIVALQAGYVSILPVFDLYIHPANTPLLWRKHRLTLCKKKRKHHCRVFFV